jgi:hypothetical protein
MIFLLIYLASFLVVWRPLFRNELKSLAYRDCPPDWEQVILAAITATAMGLFAPFILIGWTLKVTIGQSNPATLARRVGGESREQKDKRLEREKKAREAYIRRLERELGVGE